MKQIILTISLLFLVCSCAGIDQHISFVEPPSNWKKVLSTKSLTLPTGEIVLDDSYLAEWQTNNNSSILGKIVLGKSYSAEWQTKNNSSILMHVLKQTKVQLNSPKTKGVARYESLTLANKMDREGVCRSTIDNEVIGLFRNKYKYFEMELTLPCRISDSEFIMKLLSIVIGSEEYIYSFLLFAHEENFVNSRKVLDQLLESIVFTKVDSSK